ncbi:glycoside hydrolase family 92 protein [Pedobacter yulinensis]|uniref:Glycoside hydrolase family 92 protein n=1 Tax=Pedobacter yulinensis TaxID=2126353 RepID=A0A2T3HHB1_9SPHI|nr:GH92 family glycosyl hydrolase [Pedobacter yulinensis]PST81835.1 glycoside hydrolase family 92 protein [Pedobacter yulinensis]
MNTGLKHVVLRALLLAGVLLQAIPWSSADARAQEKEPADYADPLLGTSESRWMLNPGATLPFGMVQISPDNQGGVWKSGYEYSLNNVGGFSHIHSWTMAGLSVMPTVGVLNVRRGPADGPTTGWTTGYRSRIDKNTERASPGFYGVTLMNGNIRTEITSTTRAGFFRFVYPEAGDAHILFDMDIPFENTAEVLEARFTQVSPYEIEGYSKQRWSWNEYTVHFVIRFDRPMETFGAWQEGNITRGIKTFAGKGKTGAFADFKPAKGDTIRMHTAISLVSIPQARLNLETEMTPFGWNFDAVHKSARKVWNGLLGKIRVEGGSETNRRKFYTNLYRSYVARTTWSDVNGKYIDVNEKERQVDPGSPVLGSDAFWNTFWNLNQLWTLVNPDIAGKWSRSFLEIYKTGGWLPKGPAGIEYSGIMEASHEIALLVSSYQKGIRDFDVPLAFQAMVHQQTTPGVKTPENGFAGNKFFDSYMKLGYVPNEEGQVSNTLEYAYDDWCVAQMARSLGKKKEYNHFLSRAGNYRNVWDAQVGYVRMKNRDGSWVSDWSPYCCTSFSGPGYLEGNAWQYSFFNPHDVQGILNLMGKDEFNKRLNEGFEKSVRYNFNAEGDLYDLVPINHGNQPNMQAAWLFNYSGQPWLTQKWTKAIMRQYYGATPYQGWLGDEDEGQMGAWFVMAALGLFETDGGTSARPFYEIGSPLFPKATISLDPKYYKGGSFSIEARNVSDQNIYVQSAKLNGKPLTKPWFYHEDLVKGGSLVLEMGAQPNKNWGSAPADAPPSMSKPKYAKR